MNPRTLQLLTPPFLRLTYRVPEDTPAGQLCWAPLGGRWTLGVVLSPDPGETSNRPIRDAVPIPIPPLPSWTLALLESFSALHGIPTALLPGALVPPELPRGPSRYVRLVPDPGTLQPRGHRQRALVEIFRHSGRRWMRADRLCRRIGVRPAWLDRHVERGWLENRYRWPDIRRGRIQNFRTTVAHTPAQSCAIQEVPRPPDRIRAFPARPFAERLACVRSWLQTRPVLVVVPDEGLMKHWLGGIPELVPYTSSLPKSHRQAVWWGVREGQIRGVVGTPSALWLPFDAPPLWVLDEPWMDPFQDPPLPVLERRAAHVQVFFSGMPFSVLQASHWHFPTGFPTLRPWTVRAVPYGREAALQALIRETKRGLRSGGQVAIWVARRGLGWVRCEPCGYAPLCPHCGQVLVLHREGPNQRVLSCHRCGYRSLPPTRCPSCGGETWTLQGLGTQGVQETLQHVLGEPVLRLDRDTRASRKQVEPLWFQGKARILVGTWAARDALVAPGVRARILFLPELHLVGGLEDERRWISRVIWMDSMQQASSGIQRVLLTHRPDFPVFQAIRRGDVPAYLRFLYRLWRSYQASEGTEDPPRNS